LPRGNMRLADPVLSGPLRFRAAGEDAATRLVTRGIRSSLFCAAQMRYCVDFGVVRRVPPVHDCADRADPFRIRLQCALRLSNAGDRTAGARRRAEAVGRKVFKPVWGSRGDRWAEGKSP